MDPRTYFQHIVWAAVTSVFMAVFLFQVIGGLDCYSCTEEGDSRCSAKDTNIIQCGPAMNICIDYLYVASTANLTLTLWKKGCSSGPTMKWNDEILDEHLQHKVEARACSTSLCNNDVMNFPSLTPTGSATDFDNQNGMECYSCLSFSKDQCSPQNAGTIKCTGHMTQCYEGNETVSINNGYPPQTFYIKSCAKESVCFVGYSYPPDEPMTYEGHGSCCNGKLCNGPDIVL
ncbi:ly6/PLAUR domain-containing protein 3 isoform X2 [Microcaecilia unicolor]|uniref:Ly6/PLAUR domain-containing protein 3-like isoform X2 n=1 Tax=Microcaecilia unicolor TaxID=1415580 RepID=A0A6P7YSJ0_9AMPH|nr:ly6/PLAUR domain-containing protein 3-like isoform X2 [Microcaecilia unicolor]XP_030067939.1 ly6/PLAUR domain-containing protein 3-like isoform X2 [Microcaecilia unicolor]